MTRIYTFRRFRRLITWLSLGFVFLFGSVSFTQPLSVSQAGGPPLAYKSLLDDPGYNYYNSGDPYQYVRANIGNGAPDNTWDGTPKGHIFAGVFIPPYVHNNLITTTDQLFPYTGFSPSSSDFQWKIPLASPSLGLAVQAQGRNFGALVDTRNLAQQPSSDYPTVGSGIKESFTLPKPIWPSGTPTNTYEIGVSFSFAQPTLITNTVGVNNTSIGTTGVALVFQNSTIGTNRQLTIATSMSDSRGWPYYGGTGPANYFLHDSQTHQDVIVTNLSDGIKPAYLHTTDISMFSRTKPWAELRPVNIRINAHELHNIIVRANSGLSTYPGCTDCNYTWPDDVSQYALLGFYNSNELTIPPTSTGVYPYAVQGISAANFDVFTQTIPSYTHVHVVMNSEATVNNQPNTLQVYFQNEGDTDWTLSKWNDTTYTNFYNPTDYVLDMSSSPYWKGTVTKIGIIPSNTPSPGNSTAANFAIYKVYITDSTDTRVLKTWNFGKTAEGDAITTCTNGISAQDFQNRYGWRASGMSYLWSGCPDSNGVGAAGGNPAPGGPLLYIDTNIQTGR